MSNILLHNGDCVEFIKCLPNSIFDAVITDPPYGTTDLSFDKEYKNKDSYIWLEELKRVVKPNGYLALFSDLKVLAIVEAYGWVRRFTGSWIKPSSSPRLKGVKKPMNQQEPYGVFAHPKHIVKELTWNPIKNAGEPYTKVMRNSGYKRGGKDQIDRSCGSSWTEEGYICNNDGFRWQTDVIFAPTKSRMKFSERTIHPTQKPEKAVEVIVGWLTNPNDIVFDPFMGSGTTGVVCNRLDRNFIGCELDTSYFNIAQERIETSQQQMSFTVGVWH